MNANLLLPIGFALWIAYGVVVTNPPNDSCVLPTVKRWLMILFVFEDITLVAVVLFTIVEIIRFLLHCRKKNYNTTFGVKSERRSRKVHFNMVLASVVYILGVALWITLGATAAIPSSDIYAGSPLNGWQITLLVGGGMFLGSVIGVAVIALVRGRKLEKQDSANITGIEVLGWKQFLYFSMMMITAVFFVIGVVLFIVGVVVFNPLNRNLCDTCLHHLFGGLSIPGCCFICTAVVMSMSLILVSKKCVTTNTNCSAMVVVLLCLSVIGIPLAIVVCCFKKMEEGKYYCAHNTDSEELLQEKTVTGPT